MCSTHNTEDGDIYLNNKCCFPFKKIVTDFHCWGPSYEGAPLILHWGSVRGGVRKRNFQNLCIMPLWLIWYPGGLLSNSNYECSESNLWGLPMVLCHRCLTSTVHISCSAFTWLLWQLPLDSSTCVTSSYAKELISVGQFQPMGQRWQPMDTWSPFVSPCGQFGEDPIIKLLSQLSSQGTAAKKYSSHATESCFFSISLNLALALVLYLFP